MFGLRRSLLLHLRKCQVKRIIPDAWVERYIFPDSDIPSAKQLMEAAQDVLLMEDWHSFPQDYDRTFMCWYDNLTAAWDGLRSRDDERFFRMWRYFLLCAAGGFRARTNQIWQIVFSTNGVREGYSPADIR